VIPATAVTANIFQPLIDIFNEVLVFLHDAGLHYGMAIVVLTWLTRLVIVPLSVKQIRSMREMSAIQPQIKELREKYKDDQQRMQREMMAIYKEHGVNPFASCLPLLLQLPVFLSLFYLLQGDDFTNEVKDAGEQSWLFINDLTEKATGSELIILLVLYVGTSLAAGLISTGRNASAQQRMIGLGLPIIFGPIMVIYGFPAGLWVYWVATNIWTVGQQAVVKIFFPAPEQATPEAAMAAKAAKPPPPPPRKRKRRR
jgi:YidC/Oxa1 family membrane protein insertase